MNGTTEFVAPLDVIVQMAELPDPLGGLQPAEVVELSTDVAAAAITSTTGPVERESRPDTGAKRATISPTTAPAPSTTVAPTSTAPTTPSTTSSAAPETTQPPTVAAVSAAPPTSEAAPQVCSIGFSVNLGAMNDAALTAISQLNRVTSNIDLVSGSDISISFGGEWPTDSAPLGWTSGDGSQILINPDHPYANEPSVVLEIVTHELGHVFIGPQHVSDGSILDPQLNGQVMFSDSDRATLSTITCADLGYG